MSLIDIVNSSPLSPEQKAFWVGRIETEGQTPEIVSGIRESLQEYIDNGFQKLGVQMDPNDPQVKAEYKKMEDAVAAAEAEFAERMDDIEAETKAVAQAVTKDIDKAQANIIKSSI